ncbi:hypothetical protein [Streptacidiphilus monticola]|uniref:Uncharacterized protein n=1 Tax=Streptacidiphilus monticola TaxID=2161674 RepID=A0ABW1G2D7_9ACTN
MIELGYHLSPRFPDPPGIDYATATTRTLRHDLFCGDVFIEGYGRDLSTRWGWVPVLDFAWALCDIVEQLDAVPTGVGRRPQRAELDFTESADRLRFARRGDWVELTADWVRDDRPLTVEHRVLRREARDFLHDVLADFAELHEGLSDNPVVWELGLRFPREP